MTSRTMVLIAIGALALGACGGDSSDDVDGRQADVAEVILQDVAGADEACIRNKAATLSDEDAQFLLDNLDAADTSGFSTGLQDWVDGLVDCLDPTAGAEGPDTSAPDLSADGEADADAAMSNEEFASVVQSGLITYESLGETWASVAALVQNHTDTDLFYVDVTYNFLGDDGAPVATESSTIEVLPAGTAVPTRTRTTTDLTADLPVSVEITVFADDEPAYEPEWVELDVGPDATYSTNEYGVGTLSGTVTNPTDQPVDGVGVECLMVTGDGAIVSGTFARVDAQVAPGQTVAWEASGTDDFIAAVDAGAIDSECTAIVTR